MSELQHCCILERDKCGDVLWSWTFPSISEDQKSFIARKCSLKDLTSPIYGKFGKHWFYVSFREADPNVLENVAYVGIILWTKDFKPDMYFKLNSFLANIYVESGDPTKVLHLYLSVATRDISPSNNNGSLLFKEFCSQQANKTTRLKELIKDFGIEVIMIYNALLLQKRLIVYHHSLPVLLEWLKSFPSFTTCRNMEDNFIPWFELNEEDIFDIKSKAYYIAGCCDNTIFSRSDLYDVLVNLPAKEITVSPSSKDQLPVTKTHKEIALFMEQLANSDADEEKVVSSIDLKTKELISLIRSMSKKGEDGADYIPSDTIKERNFSPAMENFIYLLALTENISLSN